MVSFFLSRTIVRQFRFAVTHPVFVDHYSTATKDICKLRIMLQRDKIICLFDVDGTLTAPMKVSFVIVTWSTHLGVPSKLKNQLVVSKNVEHKLCKGTKLRYIHPGTSTGIKCHLKCERLNCFLQVNSHTLYCADSMLWSACLQGVLSTVFWYHVLSVTVRMLS